MTTTPNNLSTFRTLFIIKGILTLCFSLFFILYGALGFVFSRLDKFNDTSEIPFNPGYIIIVIGCIGLILSLTIGILTLLAAKYLKEVKNYNFIFVTAIINCLTGVLGILLGVFTLIELNKPEVKQLFNKD